MIIQNFYGSIYHQILFYDRSCFVLLVLGKGEYRVREWMKVVEMEKSDLGRAMDVVEYGD